jgi:peptide deformylase
MKLEIVLWPDPILLDGVPPVEEVDEEVRAIVGEMRRLMFELKGVGLAAPQAGVARRLMLICPTGHPGDDEVMINPEVLEASDDELGEEGCLSFPGMFGEVNRASKIRVRYMDLEGRMRERDLDGFTARVFLHELDHLDGVVFIDRMTAASRERLEPELAELKARYVARTA